MTTVTDKSFESALKSIDALNASGFMEALRSGDPLSVLIAVHSPKAVESRAYLFDAVYHAQMDGLKKQSKRRNKAFQGLVDEANVLTLYYIRQGDYTKALDYNHKAMALQAEISEHSGKNTADISDLFQQ